MGIQKNDCIALTKSMTNIDFSRDLKTIVCNTLVVCGDKDSANKNAAKGLTENIPKAKFQLLKNTGHEVNADTPDGLAAALTEFLRGVNII